MTLVLLLAALVANPPSVIQPSAVRPDSSDLRLVLADWFRSAARAAPGQWGVAIADERGQFLWGINPTKPLIPASIVKIFTTGFGRTIVGPNGRQITRVIGDGTLDPLSGAWKGTWALELNGDPTFEREGRAGAMLSDLADQLYHTGIRRLTGPLLVKQSNGDNADARYPSAWSRRHRGKNFAPLVGPLTLNENSISIAIAPGNRVGGAPAVLTANPTGILSLVTIRARTVSGSRNRLVYRRQASGHWIVTGSIGVRARPRTYTGVTNDPRAMLEAAWAQALAEAQIEWVQADALSAPPEATEPSVLAQVVSPTFDSVASEVNRRSSNIGAELMLRWAAAGDQGSAALLTQHVRQVTGDYTGVHLADGSGLSSEDRASPWSFASYLANFPTLPEGRNFPLLLPANGTGTLKRLSRWIPEEGVVRAKTGTLGNSATLAGYLGQKDGMLVISLMYNGSHVYDARQQQWRLFRLLGANGVVIPTDSLGAFGG